MKKLIFLLFLLLPLVSLAVSATDEYIVNHNTKECATFWAGDECEKYEIPVGWQVLGTTHEVECPAGYSKVDLKLKAQPVLESFCLLPGHSGSDYSFNYFWYRVGGGIIILALIIFIIIKKRKKVAG